MTDHAPITNEAIYREVMDVKSDVKVMRHELSRVNDHETRIRALEGNRWPMPLVMAIIAAAGVAVAIVVALTR